MEPLRKLTIALLCLTLAHRTWQGGMQKGAKKKKHSIEDFAALFKKDREQKHDQETMRLYTTFVHDAFDEHTGSLRKNFPEMSEYDERWLRDLIEMSCSDGTKVFDLRRVTLKKALSVSVTLTATAQVRRMVNVQEMRHQPGHNQIHELPASLAEMNFLPTICWNDSVEAFDRFLTVFTDDEMKEVFHMNVLAILARETAERVSGVLPQRGKEIICEQLKKADTVCITEVLKHFPGQDCLKQLARNEPSVAEAVLQKDKEMDDMTGPQWDQILNDFGSCTPRDIIRRAPSDKIKKRFAELWDRKKADVLIGKVDFAEVDEDFVTSLGDKACQLPMSSLLKIPRSKLEGGRSSLSCVKREKSQAKKRYLSKKMLVTRDAVSCKRHLEDIDPTDEPCWKQMTASDLQNVNFTNIDKHGMEKISCETARKLKSKLQLGNVSTWSEQHVQNHNWLFRCLWPGNMDDMDVDKVVEAMEHGYMNDVDLPFSLKRAVFKKMKQHLRSNGGSLGVDELTKMRGAVGAMTCEDVDELTAGDVQQALTTTLQRELSTMGKPVRRRLIRKLKPDQLQSVLCGVGEMARDVPVDMLEDMTGLGQLFTAPGGSCHFTCTNNAQCAALYSHLNMTMVSWNEASRDFLARARDSRAICGMPIEDVTQLLPETIFVDIASAFFKAECKNSALSQLFADKLRLYMAFSAQRKLSLTEVELLGGNFFKHLDLDDLMIYNTEEKRSIFQAMGQADLDDVDPDWVKVMTAAAVSAHVNDDPITETTVLFLGGLICGLAPVHFIRMTSSALTDALPELGKCSYVTQETLNSAREAMMGRLNMTYSTMDTADLSLAGIVVLSSCPDMAYVNFSTRYGALSDMAAAVTLWKATRDNRSTRWRETSLENHQRSDKMLTIADLQCGLSAVLNARGRIRKPQLKTLRGAGTHGLFTCDDLRSLGEAAWIWSVTKINALTYEDFNECAAHLGSIPNWPVGRKKALAGRAKQVWGNASTWVGNDLVGTAGYIMQGLTLTDLASVTMTEEDVDTLGQLGGWTRQQIGAVQLGGKPGDLRTNSSSLTSGLLQQLGHFLCGAPQQSLEQLNPQAYREAMSDVSEGVAACSVQQLQALAGLAVNTLGPVQSWTLAQTAAVGSVMAGLSGSDLSLLSASQLSVMDLDTFASIPPKAFASMTVEQLQSISSQQALSVTEDQLRFLDYPQTAALQDLGAYRSAYNSAVCLGGMQTTMGPLVVIATAALILLER